MTAIRVCRENSYPDECRDTDDNLSWGNDISNVLLSTEPAAVERGRVEIDKQGTNRITSNVILHQLDYIQPGSLVSVMNSAGQRNGILRNLTIKIENNQNSLNAESLLTLEGNTHD